VLDLNMSRASVEPAQDLHPKKMINQVGKEGYVDVNDTKKAQEGEPGYEFRKTESCNSVVIINVDASISWDRTRRDERCFFLFSVFCCWVERGKKQAIES
jgi:hypothetical protein